MKFAGRIDIWLPTSPQRCEEMVQACSLSGRVGLASGRPGLVCVTRLVLWLEERLLSIYRKSPRFRLLSRELRLAPR